jgi:hypothetical protein
MYPIPSVLQNDEFRQLLRVDVNFSEITHAGTLRKERKITDAMIQLLVNTVDKFEKHKDYPVDNVVKFTREFQRSTCGGGKNYSHLQDALEINGFRIDHNYQRPTLQNQGVTKSVVIPQRALEIATDYLENLNLERVPNNHEVLIDWKNPVLFGNTEVPSRVRIHTAGFKDLITEIREVNENLLERWNLHLRFAEVHDTDGWLNQKYRVSEFGRLLGLGLDSLQTTPKVILKRILKGCWEVDIRACAYAVLPTLYNQRMKVEEEFPAIRQYCRMREVIRESVSEDLDCENSLVKTAFTAIAFGMKTNVKEYMSLEEGRVTPTLTRIFRSETLAFQFRNHPEVQSVWNEMKRIFADLSRETETELNHLTRAQRVAYLYQHEESKILKSMIQFVERKLVVPKHDALVLNQMLNPDELKRLQMKVLKDTGHSIELEQVEIQ